MFLKTKSNKKTVANKKKEKKRKNIAHTKTKYKNINKTT